MKKKPRGSVKGTTILVGEVTKFNNPKVGYFAVFNEQPIIIGAYNLNLMSFHRENNVCLPAPQLSGN